MARLASLDLRMHQVAAWATHLMARLASLDLRMHQVAAWATHLSVA